MAVSGRGIDVKQTDAGELVFEVGLLDSTGAKLTTGTTLLYLYELQDDGTLLSYDFNDDTFKSTALTTETLAMTHRQGNNNTKNTGLWTAILATLTGFTNGSIIFVMVENSGASPDTQWRKFQFGGFQGDQTVSNDDLQKFIKNKKELKKISSVWYLIAYADDSSTEIMRKAIKDLDGNDIDDLVAGQLAQEIKSSV